LASGREEGSNPSISASYFHIKENGVSIEDYSRELGIDVCIEINPEALIPEERIRAYCEENKCGNYGRNYSCPPHAGELDDFREKLKEFKRGYLLQYSEEMDTRKDLKKLLRSKDDFHEMVLKLEEYLRKQGINKVWGLIGGNCGLCRRCKILKGKPCKHPDKARVSLEAIGIDVVGLLEKLGLDSHFHRGKVTWTGCVLY
jgi:predicted metal-binding protein